MVLIYVTLSAVYNVSPAGTPHPASAPKYVLRLSRLLKNGKIFEHLFDRSV